MKTTGAGILMAVTIMATLFTQSCSRSDEVAPSTAHVNESSGTERSSGDPFIRTAFTGTASGDIKYLIYDHACHLAGVLYTRVGMAPVAYVNCTSTNFTVRDYTGATVTLLLHERYVITPWNSTGPLETMVAVYHDLNAPLGWTLFNPCGWASASTPVWRFSPGVGPTGSWACNLAPVTTSYESSFNMGLPTCP